MIEEKKMTLKQSQIQYKKVNKYLKKNYYDLDYYEIVKMYYDIYFLLQDLNSFNLTDRDKLILSFLDIYYEKG